MNCLVLSKDELNSFFQIRAIEANWRLQLAQLLQVLVPLIYIFFALSLIKKQEKKNLNIFSELEKIDLNWLKILLWTFGVIWFIISVNVLIYEFSQARILVWAHYTFTILFVFFIFFIGYQGIKKANIFLDVYYSDNQNSILDRIREFGLGGRPPGFNPGGFLVIWEDK